jgi:two-component system chemotaxis response regulator CheB
VLVVLHVPSGGRSALPAILERSGRLGARHAVVGDRLEAGEILVAPPDRHLIVYDHAVTLSRGPSENGHRPAVDVLFRSAARALGPRVVGLVLSGALDDGAAGSVAIKLRGGVCIAQDPDEALYASMPRSAIQAGGADHVLPVHDVPKVLGELFGQEVPDPPLRPSSLMEMEASMAELDPEAIDNPDRPGTPAGFSCPDCHGSLYQITEGGLVRFRCRVGHAWSPHSLLAQQSSAHESALWIALRSLEEKAELTRSLAARAGERGHVLTAKSFQAQSDESVEAAGLVRELIDQIGGASTLDSASAVVDPD